MVDAQLDLALSRLRAKLANSAVVPGTSPGRGIGAELLSPSETRQLLPGFPAGLRLWDSQQTAIGDLYYERALGFRCRTHSPASADLFFVPAYTQDIDSQSHCAESPGALLRRLQAVRVGNVSALERRGGTDHVLLNPRPGGHFESPHSFVRPTQTV